MPNIVDLVKTQILRLARKEAETQIAKSRKSVTEYRRQIAELKRLLGRREREIRLLKRQAGQSQPAEEDPLAGTRFSSRSVRVQRQRLGLSAKEYSKLLGVTVLTLRSWESGKSRPRKAQFARLVALRGIGKEAALAKLAELAKLETTKKKRR
jgi:DNA-binding transcriptional regulator YiaG